MKNIKTFMKRGAALLLAGVTAMVLVTGCGQKTPMQTIEGGFKTLASNVSEEYSILNILADAQKGGSIRVNVSLDEIIKSFTGMNIKDVDGSIAMIYGKDDAALTIGAELNDTPIFDANMYVDKEGVAVKSEALFGEDVAYGTEFKGMDDRFSRSIFAYGGEFDDYAYELEAIATYFSYAEKLASMTEDFQSFWSELKGEIYAAIEGNSESSVEKGEYSADGDSVKTYNAAIVAKDGQICDLLGAVCGAILDFDDFEDFCDDYGDVFEYFDMPDIYGAIEDLKEEIEDQRDDMDGNELEIYAHIGRATKELIAFELQMSGEGDDDYELKFECTPASKGLRTAEFSVVSGDYETTFTYEIKENTKDEYKCELEVSVEDGDYDYTETLFEYSWDKSAGDFKLKVADVEIRGEATTAKDKATIVIDSFKADGIEMEFETFEIVIKAKDEMPKIEEYEDILTVSAGEFEEIVKPIFELGEGLASLLG